MGPSARRALLTLLLPGLLIAACAAPPRPPATGAVASEGHALAWRLFSENREVAGVFVIKGAPAETEALVREIAATSAAIAEELERQARQAGWSLDRTGLPLAEEAARARIRAETSRALLAAFGASFERRLLLTQVEALGYGAALLAVVAEVETDPLRRRSLEERQQEVERLRTRVVRRLEPVR